MKIRFIPKRKLKAATAARRMPRGGFEEYAPEPNMSFGRAIVVVIVLHLVAVGGIYAFSSLKLRNISQQYPPVRPKETAASLADTGPATPKLPARAAAQETQTTVKPAGPAATSVKPIAVANTAVQTAPAAPNASAPPVKDSGTFYTVAKGDTLVSIARKLHVSREDLLNLNKINDAKKLKIGQKLRIPLKKKTVSHA